MLHFWALGLKFLIQNHVCLLLKIFISRPGNENKKVEVLVVGVPVFAAVVRVVWVPVVCVSRIGSMKYLQA